MQNDEVQNKLGFLIDAAMKAGATAADGIRLAGDGESLSLRNGEVDSLERDESLDYGLRVFVDGRVASVSTNRDDKDTLQTLAERAVAMAKLAPVDPFAQLQSADALAQNFEDQLAKLDLFDSFEPAAKLMIERARAAEAAAQVNKGISQVDSVGAGWSKTYVALATSAGFFGQSQGSSHGFSALCLAGEGSGMQRDYDSTSARHFEDLEAPEKIGTTAAERCVARLNPTKHSTRQIPVIYDKRVSGSLLAGLAGAINGSSIARGSSFLKDAMDTEILNACIQIHDDPHRVRGFGSKVFDAEGTATQPRQLVKDGVLQGWILDLATAAQLKLGSSGNAARGLSGSPGPSVTNFYMAAGEQSLEEMIGELEEGFLITDMMGHGLNMNTGAYSRGAGGFWIRNGELAEAVNEMTVAGQMKDMFKAMQPASDLEFRSSLSCPSLRIDGMTVAGL